MFPTEPLSVWRILRRGGISTTNACSLTNVCENVVLAYRTAISRGTEVQILGSKASFDAGRFARGCVPLVLAAFKEMLEY